MQSIAFAVLLPPGQTEATVAALTSCWVGARKEPFQDARRRAGILREAVWIQSMPGGDLAIVYVEADDLNVAFTVLGTSPEPFDCWFRAHAHHVHGIAWDGDLPAPEVALDFDTNRI